MASSTVCLPDEELENQFPSSVSKSDVRFPILPPCRICGDCASGLHYGVNTCQACKVFFRRCLARKRVLQECVHDKSCRITLHARSHCVRCRYDKCLRCGMSRNAIKIGRYSSDKRTQDTYEMKRLSHPVEENVCGYGPYGWLKTERPDTPPETVADPEPTMSTPHFHRRLHEEWFPHVLDGYDPGEIIYHLTAAHLQTDGTARFLLKSEREDMECVKLKMQLFGQLKPLTNQEYNDIYRVTGLDVDNRKHMIVRLFKTMEFGLRKMIDFVKVIPDYKRLNLEDQSSLLKGVNTDLKIFTVATVAASNLVLHIDDMEKVWSRELLMETFDICKSLQVLRLSVEETALIKAICVTFTDRVLLKSPDQVETIHRRMIACLVYSIENNHPDPRSRFLKIWNRLIAMREMDEYNIKSNKLLTNQWSDVLQEFSLLNETLL